MELEWLSVSKDVGTTVSLSGGIFLHRNKGEWSTGGFFYSGMDKLFKYDEKTRDTTYKRALPWEFMV